MSIHEMKIPPIWVWLVVDLPLWKMIEFVSWDYDIPNIWKNKKSSKPPTRSIQSNFWSFSHIAQVEPPTNTMVSKSFGNSWFHSLVGPLEMAWPMESKSPISDPDPSFFVGLYLSNSLHSNSPTTGYVHICSVFFTSYVQYVPPKIHLWYHYSWLNYLL